MTYYEAVYAHPEGESTVARLALTASEQGYGGVVVRDTQDAAPEYDSEGIEEAYGVDVVDAVEVDAASPDEASGHLGRLRRERTLVAVRGGTPGLNRFAVEQAAVDVLAHPMRGEGDVNHVLVRAAAENGVRLAFEFGPVLRESGGRRVQALRGLRKLRELVAEYDAPYVVSGGPRSHLQLRAPRELLAVGETVGFDRETVETGLREWGRLASRNRDRRGESFIEPGVERGRYEEES